MRNPNLGCALSTLLDHLQNLRSSLFYSSHCYLSSIDGTIDEVERSPLVRAWHFKVETGVECMVNAVHAKPVTHNLGFHLRQYSGYEMGRVVPCQRISIPDEGFSSVRSYFPKRGFR